MNKWTKGSKAEKLYIDKLIKEDGNWWCYRAPKAKYNQQDMFGCDIVAVNVGEVRFIQVKSCKARFPSMDKLTEWTLNRLFMRLPKKCRVFWAGYRWDKKTWKEVEIR